MNEIMMGKPKHVGDSAMITDLGDGMLVLGTPTVAYNPVTKQDERIKEIIKHPQPTNCPNCKKQNPPGVEITFLETGFFIYPCPSCNQFVWCRLKGK